MQQLNYKSIRLNNRTILKYIPWRKRIDSLVAIWNTVAFMRNEVRSFFTMTFYISLHAKQFSNNQSLVSLKLCWLILLITEVSVDNKPRVRYSVILVTKDNIYLRRFSWLSLPWQVQKRYKEPRIILLDI